MGRSLSRVAAGMAIAALGLFGGRGAAAQGVAHWSAVFKLESTGKRVALDGVFVLTFNAAGQCTLLREWWQAGTPGN